VITLASVLPVLAAGDEHGGGGGFSLVRPEWGLIVWTSLTFVLLAFLLGRFAWKPLLGAIEQRERLIEDSLGRAKAEREQAEKLLEEHRALVAEVQRARAGVLEDAEKEGQRLKDDLLEEARRQRERLLRQTEEQVEASLAQAKAELRGTAVDLAIQAAGRLLEQNLDDVKQRKLVEDYLVELEGDSSGPVASS